MVGKLKTFVIAAVVAFGWPSIARSAVPPIAKGAVEESVRSGATVRTVQIFRPADVPASTALPLVIMLHGLHTDGDDDEYFYHWDGLARTAHFVVAYPSGEGKSWNAGDCCAPANKVGTDDVRFLSDLARQMSTEAASAPGGLIDESRVYVAGFSNGAMMAYRLACESPFAFAAFASAEGALVSPCPSPRPTSFLELHGLADTGIPFAGRSGGEHGGETPLPSSFESVQPFVRADGCGVMTTVREAVQTTQRWQCGASRTVEIVSVPGLAHAWPEIPHQTLSAPELMWDFFRLAPPAAGVVTQ